MHSFCISCNKYHQKGFKKHEFKLNQQLLQYLNSLSTSVYNSFVLFFFGLLYVSIFKQEYREASSVKGNTGVAFLFLCCFSKTRKTNYWIMNP